MARVGYSHFSIAELTNLLNGIMEFKFCAGENGIIETPDSFNLWVKKPGLNTTDLKQLIENHLSHNNMPRVGSGFKFGQFLTIYVTTSDLPDICRISAEIVTVATIDKAVCAEVITLESIIDKLHLEIQPVPNSWAKYVYNP